MNDTKQVKIISVNGEVWIDRMIEFYKTTDTTGMSPNWTKDILLSINPTFYIIYKDKEIIAASAITTEYKALVAYWNKTRPHSDDFPKQSQMTYFFFGIVSQKERGSGLHKKMILHRLSQTKTPSYCYIHKDSTHSLKNLKRFGFAEWNQGRSGDYLALCNLPTIT